MDNRACQTCGGHVPLLTVHIMERRADGAHRYWHVICWLSRGRQHVLFEEQRV
jgi:hypothetical protein